MAEEVKASAKSRYFLICQACLHQRVADGEITVVHVSDEQNPSDFLTKSVPHFKAELSARYAMAPMVPTISSVALRDSVLPLLLRWTLPTYSQR